MSAGRGLLRAALQGVLGGCAITAVIAVAMSAVLFGWFK